ncbi:MAG: SMP-30/gluconolactonase/LRE family protein [Streptosporangiaceae bacterium]
MTRTLSVEIVLDARAELGEGPAWDAPAERLVWVDITGGTVHELRPNGATRSWKVDQHVGAAAPRASGGMLLAVHDGFATLEDGGLRMLAPVEADKLENRMNDGKCDPQGRMWAGTMPYDEQGAGGALYRMDPDERVHTMLTGTQISNGLCWSPDQRTMYYIDTPTLGVDAFDFDAPTGAIANRRRVVTIEDGPGMPDGMTIDDEGCLWVALFGGGQVRRYTPDGSLDAVVEAPASQTTSCAFGGPGRDELYITSAARGKGDEEPHAGALFRCRPGVTGPAATPYAG